jgi:hypothetical protein
MVRMHEREAGVRAAEADLQSRLLEWQKSSVVEDLTPLEMMRVVQSVLGDELSSMIKYEIRYERHGDYDSPGGRASSDED